MRVLVACEFSGIVRDAFIRKGHDAVSCDFLPTEAEGPHIIGDVRNILGDGWDMMIAHPPCTYLSNAGIRWFNEDRYGKRAVERKSKREWALGFILRLMGCKIPKIAIENPVGYINSEYRKPDQIVHPYYFDEPHIKATCLWLKNLPLLRYETKNIPEPLGVTYRKPSKYYNGGEIKKHYFTQMEKTRGGHERSRTFKGIAEAMAEQWG